jgi:hypothetical protein
MSFSNKEAEGMAEESRRWLHCLGCGPWNSGEKKTVHGETVR